MVNKSRSHLYPGFRGASWLPSVAQQRQVQRSVVEAIARDEVMHVATVGCGYGDEMDVVFGGLRQRCASLSIWACDLKNTVDAVLSTPLAQVTRVSFMQRNLLDLSGADPGSHFDVVQVGFVLHDVPYALRDEALERLLALVRPGGRLIVSDIFCPRDCVSQSSRAEFARRVYDYFLREATAAHRRGHLCKEAYRALLGSDDGPGLNRSRRDASRGGRDYFESLALCRARLANHPIGITVHVIPNEVVSFMNVIVATVKEL